MNDSAKEARPAPMNTTPDAQDQEGDVETSAARTSLSGAVEVDLDHAPTLGDGPSEDAASWIERVKQQDAERFTYHCSVRKHHLRNVTKQEKKTCPKAARTCRAIEEASRRGGR